VKCRAPHETERLGDPDFEADKRYDAPCLAPPLPPEAFIRRGAIRFRPTAQRPTQGWMFEFSLTPGF